MIRIAITGGIGCGKTYVANLLETVMHIPVYNADTEAKRLMVSDPGIRHGLTALLGPEVYCEQTLNKPLLSSYLFANPGHAAQINAIVHPQVKKDFARWLEERQECEIAAIESAILYEAGFEDTVDAVVMVGAPLELRVARAMERDGATEQQVRARIAAQMDDEEKRKRAGYFINNDGKEPLLPQLEQLVEHLKTGKFAE